MKKTLAFILIVFCLVPLFAQSVAEVSESSDELRIVSLGPNVTEIIYALGAGDSLVGRTDYCNYPEQAFSVTSIGTLWEPNLEAILGLNANIAIASSIVDPSFIESLNNAGISSFQFYEEESLEAPFAMILPLSNTISSSQNWNASSRSCVTIMENPSKSFSKLASSRRNCSFRKVSIALNGSSSNMTSGL